MKARRIRISIILLLLTSMVTITTLGLPFGRLVAVKAKASPESPFLVNNSLTSANPLTALATPHKDLRAEFEAQYPGEIDKQIQALGLLPCSGINFPGPQFTTGSGPSSVAIGDLDGDGKLDLAIANGTADSISVLLNTSTTGSISFAAKQDFTTGSGPSSVAIGDLDGDGKLDLAIANIGSSTGANGVSVLLNTSTGSGNINFATKQDFTTGSGPISVAIGDLDGDGKLDLAIANGTADSISVLRNTSTTGSISFAAKQDFTTGSGPSSVAIGDLDGDGKLDLAIANGTADSVSVLLNTSTSGSISFATKQDFTTGTTPISVAIGDLDGDGKLDLAIANNIANTVSVLLNTSTTGSTSFAAKQDFTTGTNPQSVAIGDLDGDGKLDLAIANGGSNSVSALRNTSSGSGNIAFAAKQDFSTGSLPSSVAIGDLDGNGKLDLAIANQSSNSVSALRNTSSGSGNINFATKQDFTTGSQPVSVAIGDLDGDGKLDLAIANFGSNSVSVLLNTSTTGSISFAAKQDFTTGSQPFSVAIGDLDGDGKLDLAIANFASNSVSVLLNTSTTGNINFATKQDFTTGTRPISVAIGDLDGDGKLDLAIANSGSTGANGVSVLLNTSTGSGNINFATKQDFTTGSQPISVAIGDLDGDGKLDLAIANNSSNSVSVLRNTSTTGSISFATKQDFTTGSRPISVAIGDLDGDGKLDLATANFVTTGANGVSVLLNTSTTGSISFAAKQDFTTGSSPESVAIGDLDGDGKLDLATANNGSTTGANGVSVLRNTSTSGSISFAAKQDFTTGSRPFSVAIGDLDGNGKLDLAIANSSSASVSILANSCIASTTTTLTTLPNPSTFGQSVTLTATVTGSGTTGTVTFMDGATTLGTGTLTSGVAMFSTSTLSVGTHSLTAMYGGDTNFAASTSNTVSQVVNQAATVTTLSAAPTSSVFGQSVTFTASVTSAGGTPTGFVTFMDGSTTLGMSAVNGSGMVTFSTATLSVATHSLTAIYGGDTNFTGSTSNTLSFTVSQASTTTTVMTSGSPSNFGSSVTFTAHVSTVAPGTGTPTGTVQFRDGAANLGSPVTLTSGSATFSTSALTGGSHSITAVYSGDTNFTTSTATAITQVVNAVASTSTLTANPTSSVFGQSVMLSVTVTGSGGAPTGTVQFKDGATNIGSPVTLTSGSASISTSSLSVGTHSLTAVYSGDNHFNSSTSNTVSFTVSQATTSTAVVSSSNPSVFEQSVTFTATVTVTGGAGTPTGTVTFKDGVTTLGTSSLTGGTTAAFSTATLSIATHSITAMYNGDTNFAGSTSGTLSQVVNKANTTTVVVSSVNPSQNGQAVTFTATVSASSPSSGSPTGPSGSVTFFDGSTSLGTGTLSSGVATFTTSSLTPGSHSITAVYSGDGNFNGSTSAALIQSVGGVDHNTLYVADTLNNRIQRSTNDGTTWQFVGNGAGTGLGQFNQPQGVATNFADTIIFVADTGNNRVQRSTNGGSSWQAIATAGTATNKVNAPQAVAYDEINDILYIADTNNNRILKVMAASTASPSFSLMASNGVAVGQVNQPQGIAVDGFGFVYIADTLNNRVQMFNGSWSVLAAAGTTVGKVARPAGVYVNNNGVVFIADTGNNRIQTISKGAAVFMAAGTAVGTVNAPQGVTFTNSGNAFIADTGNNRIQKKNFSSGVATVVGAAGTTVGKFNQPAGIR